MDEKNLSRRNRYQQESVNRSRRIFLKSLLAGSALVALDQLGGRRLTDALANAAGGTPTYGLPRFEPSEAVGKGFDQSVAAGDPTPTGAVLWTRIDPSLVTGIRAAPYDPQLVQWLDNSAGEPNDSVRRAIEEGKFLMVELAETPDFSEVKLTGYTPVWKDYDNVVKVDVDGWLEPRKTYYYRFVAKTGHVSQTGRFRTLVPEGADLASLRFAYVSCQDYTNGYYHALRFAAEEEVDFVIHLGDYVYESVGDPTYQSPLPDRQIKLPSGKSKAFTIEDYRTLYRTYKSDPDLKRLHERHAMISIWDDHEFANDTYYPAVAPDDSLDSDPDRRRTANRVWFEYTPARVRFDPSKGFRDSLRIYRSLKAGNLAEFIFTDERLYRSSHPCGEETLDRYFTAGCPRMNDPSQTMLGAGVSQQKEWFLNRMKNSDALWKIWGNEVQFTPLKVLSRYMNLDAWDGFAGERKEITQALKDAGVKNFLTITGDLHTYEAGLIKEDYENDPDDAAVGVEFMVGSVTSSNLSEMVHQAATNTVSHSNPVPSEAMDGIITQILGAATPLTSALVDKVAGELDTIIKTENPWIKLFNSNTHGYCVMELTPYKAAWTAYSVSDTQSRDAQKSLLFQCEVPKDQARIHILKK
ncbi:alkaline phosphatase D [Melghirimyces profundicolus]|uniref:Alkaline phosphatase D n=1 Tax=Melghirimyces profundicolus TaxID=1242148 RepID=A0A2T6BFZ3_9BACL|nr:alkaline phosphatase D family protein [Melghirimyces profundicolus]PTX54985.1 alkaline phosphatase D [Melghirimyces profundicolus]